MSQDSKCSQCKEGMDGFSFLVKASCGDVFHFSCVGELGTGCPECNSIINRTELVSFESVKEVLKAKEEIKLKNSNYQEKQLIDWEKAVERITSQLQNRLYECEKNIKALFRVKTQKIHEWEKRIKICEANIDSQQKILLNEFEKKVESINQYNAQQHNENNNELNDKNWNVLQNRLNECEKKLVSLKQSNDQLKMNVMQTNDLQNSQDGSEKNAEALQKLNAKLEVGIKNISRLQNRMHECEKNIEYMKKVNAVLELGVKQSQDFQKRLDENENRVHCMEKMMMELQQKVNQSVELKTVSMAPTPNDLLEMINSKEIPKEIKNILHELQMSVDQVSLINAQKFERVIKNAMAEKNQIIKDLEQQLTASNLALEQEKENLKLISMKYNKQQKYLIATLMPDEARDLVKMQQNILMANDSSDISVNIVKKNDILPDEPNIGSAHKEDDYQK